MWIVQPGDGSPDDGVPDDGVPGDGAPGWDGADQDDASGALDGPRLLGSDDGEGLGQGLWLTASAPLPPGLMSSVAAGGGTGVFGFGQGGVLEALPPGPVLAAFAAEAAGGICGTGVPDPEAADPDRGVKADGHGQHSDGRRSSGNTATQASSGSTATQASSGNTATQVNWDGTARLVGSGSSAMRS